MSVEDRYYKINRALLKAVGLWPYQDRKWMYIYAIFTILMYLSAIFVQLAVLITHEFTVNMVVEVLSFTLPSIFMLFMYDMYYFKFDKLREIMEYMYYDWKFFKDKAESSILDNYANLSRIITYIFTFLLIIGVTVTIISHIIPLTFDLVWPLNHSRAQDIHIITEYFLDPSKYYYVTIIHLSTFICVGCVTLMAIGTSLVSYGLHACATLKITNYRMKITMDKNILQLSGSRMERAIHERIVRAVDAHRRSIRFINLLIRSFEKSFLLMIILGVTSLSINLFRLLKALTAFNQIVEMFIPSALVFCHFCYLFIANHIGQLVTNNNAEIFNTVYSLPWYLTSINTQRLLIFLLQKGQKDMYLSTGGIFDASYECFATLTTSSISYFTVIYTIQ